jgi:surface antigen
MVSMSSADASDSPDILTNGSYAIGADGAQLLLSTGTKLYATCRSITTFSVDSGKATMHVSGDIISGVWDSVDFVGRGFSNVIMISLRSAGEILMFSVRTPSHVIDSIASGHAVNDIIKPTDNSKAIPVISSETSAAALASLSAAQQQEIEQLQTAQLAANQRLDGQIVAGDPNHGGYPDRWNNVRQDSTLDSWGMYNRECVSYAAWKVYQTYGNMPYWGGVGNANEWIGDAEHAGIPIGSIPKVHSVAIWHVGYYGHAMWVEAVNGNMIYVSQYNYDLNGHYSEMWVNGSDFTYIYFH